MPLTPDEIEEIRLHAHRYAGPFTPTYHRLATAVERLAGHIQETKTVCGDDVPTEAENAEARDHILRGAEELKRARAVAGWKRITAESAARLHGGEPPRCESCRWWQAIEASDEDRGLCRASLPMSPSPGDVMGEWLQTLPGDWCRHHEPRLPHPLRVLGSAGETAGGG